MLLSLGKDLLFMYDVRTTAVQALLLTLGKYQLLYHTSNWEFAILGAKTRAGLLKMGLNCFFGLNMATWVHLLN